ncbi:MAG: FG-GAP repeat domain-containing protein [Lysobacterales bacterium]
MSKRSLAFFAILWSASIQAQPAFFLATQDLRGPFIPPFSQTTMTDIAIADIDGDGDNDLVMSDSGGGDRGTVAFFNDGLGFFTPSTQRIGVGDATALALRDLNGDNFPDLVLANFGESTTNDEVYLNNGAGYFILTQILASSRTSDVVVADFSGDGVLDLFFPLSINTITGSPNVFYQGIGDGTFLPAMGLFGTSVGLSGAAGDLDGDGDMDVFLGNSGPNEVLINNGGTLMPSAVSYGNAFTSDVLLGDVDRDGDLDAVTINSRLNFDTNEGQPNRLWLNNGAGTFVDSGVAFENERTRSAALVDIDNDGWLDLWFGNFDIADTIWLNQNGTFVAANADLGIGQISTTGVSAADLDGDGDPDFAITDFNGNRVWLNAGGSSEPGVSIAQARAFTDASGRPQLYALEGFPLGIPLRVNGSQETDVPLAYTLTSPLDTSNSELLVRRPGSAITINPVALPEVDASGTLQLALSQISEVPLSSPVEADYRVINVDNLRSAENGGKIGLDLSETDDCLADFICLCVNCSLVFCNDTGGKGNQTSGLMLTQLRRLRDEVMLPSASGRYFSDLYYAFGSELITTIFSHPTLIYDVMEANRLWSPAIDSVLDGDGSYPISPEMGGIYREVTEQLKTFGSPELRQQIEQEDRLIQPVSFVGRTAGEYWDAVTSARTEGVFRDDFEATPL